MKIHDLADHLEKLAKFLRQLPNEELESGGVSCLQEQFSRPESIRFSNDIWLKIDDMSPSEVEEFFLSDKEFFTKSNITELAKYLKLTPSARQSKNAILNMIVRHLEARKMHSIMRSAKADGL